MSTSKQAMLEQQIELAYHSVLETLPGGEIIANLRLQLGVDEFLRHVYKIWETALESVYYNVNDEVRDNLNNYLEAGDWETLYNYIIKLCVDEAIYLSILGSGAVLGAKMVAQKNNISL
jgi:hypothetical protein